MTLEGRLRGPVVTGHVPTASPIARGVVISPRVLFRGGISNILSTRTQTVIVASGSDRGDAERLAATHRPDLMVLDLDDATLDSHDAIASLVKANSKVRLVGLAGANESRAAATIRRAKLGVVLARSADAHLLVSAVAAVTSMSSERTPRGRRRQASSAPTLTQRQIAVLLLAARGMSNSQIAASLGIREGTVKRHLFNVFQAVSASSRIDAVNRARALGISI